MAVNYKVGDISKRPWGMWEAVDVGSDYAIKRITVNPHQKLSLQSHEFRSEHWIVISGTGLVTLDEKNMNVFPNQHVYIKPHQKHRITNETDLPVVVIEVQTGDTLDENDIRRYEDDYGRV